MQLDFVSEMPQYKVTMKFRRFSAFFLVGFFVILLAILLSSKPVSSDWDNDITKPTALIQVYCNNGIGNSVSNGGVCQDGSSAEIHIKCHDGPPIFGGCKLLSYTLDGTNQTYPTDTSLASLQAKCSPKNVDMEAIPLSNITEDASGHTITAQAEDCAGNISDPVSFSFTFQRTAPTPTLTPIPIPTLTATPTPTPTSIPPTSSPVPTVQITPIPPEAWFQGVGGDMRIDDSLGFVDVIPPSVPTPAYVSLQSDQITPTPTTLWSNTPGVIYSGANSKNFGSSGLASSKNWLVVGFPSPLAYSAPRNISYQGVLNTLNRNGRQAVNITKPLCTDSNVGCDLAPLLTGSNNIYKLPARISYIYSATPLANTNIIIADKKVVIKGNITLASGAFLLLVVKGEDPAVAPNPLSIVVEPTVTLLQGFYSADHNFDIQTQSTGPDSPLILEGLAVANAAGGGKFNNQRKLTPPTNPSVRLIERPDLILRTPEILKTPNYVWQEVAP